MIFIFAAMVVQAGAPTLGRRVGLVDRAARAASGFGHVFPIRENLETLTPLLGRAPSSPMPD